MIVSANTDEQPREFEKLLKKSKNKIDSIVKKNAIYFTTRSPTEFEEDVYENMCAAAKKTPFEDTIELISGHKFPDIVAQEVYGVEVKTTRGKYLKSTGNSVLETTRIENVDNIYIFFGKLAAPVEFKIRRYEECLYNVAVTHSPRYLIDMELEKGNSIFDKMKTTYDELRRLKNPIQPIVNYYRENVKNGEEPWWMGSTELDDEVTFKPTVTLWNNLDKEIQNQFKIEAMARYPEIFGNSPTKYQRLATWLAGRHGIVDSSLRDRFTAGGQETVTINGKEYSKSPKVFWHLKENAKEVVKTVECLPLDEAKYFWGMNKLNEENKIETWVELVIKNASKTLKDAKAVIIHILGYTIGPKKSPKGLIKEMKRYGLE